MACLVLVGGWLALLQKEKCLVESRLDLPPTHLLTPRTSFLLNVHVCTCMCTCAHVRAHTRACKMTVALRARVMAVVGRVGGWWMGG